MALKHLAAGMPCPPLVKDKLRCYSMRFCPFAQRARIVLHHKQIDFEEVNIALKSKPEWFLEKNPRGTVPVLEKGDKRVWESGVCMEYLDEMYPEHPLYPRDPYLKAHMKIDMEDVSKISGPYYKLFANDGALAKDDEAQESLKKGMDEWEKKLKTPFFAGEAVGMIDYYIWPFFERMPMLDIMAGSVILQKARFPGLVDWVERMMTTPGVKGTVMDAKAHHQFFLSISSAVPEYDLGL